MNFQLFNSKTEPEDAAPKTEPALEKYVTGLVRQSSGLGKGAAELNGLIGDLAEMSSTQAKTFTSLASEIDAMVQANRTICDVTKASNEVGTPRQASGRAGRTGGRRSDGHLGRRDRRRQRDHQDCVANEAGRVQCIGGSQTVREKQGAVSASSPMR